MLAFITKNHALTAVRKPLPSLRRDWALVRVRLAGICNTDVEILRGYHNFRGTPGHEFVGEVVDVRGARSHEEKSWLGRRVGGEINIACARSRIPPTLRILPPRIENPLRATQSARNRRSRRRIRRISRATARKSSRHTQHGHRRASRLHRAARRSLRDSRSSSGKRIPQGGRTRRRQARAIDRHGAQVNRHSGRDVRQTLRKARAREPQRNQDRPRPRQRAQISREC